MSQLSFDVYPFQERCDWNKLAAAIDKHPSHSHLGAREGSLLGRLGQEWRKVYYWDHADDDRLRDVIEEHGFRIKDVIPKGYIQLTVKPTKGQKQDHDRLEREVRHAGRLKSFVDGDTVWVFQSNEVEVMSIITQCGYELKDKRSAPERLGYR